MKKYISLLVAAAFAVILLSATAFAVDLIVDLIADGGEPIPIVAGFVTVSDDGSFLSVIYTTTGPWKLVETHVHVADNVIDIPQRNGNPPPGKFDYKADHSPAVTTYTEIIPLGNWNAGTDLCIAAHAELVDDTEADPDDWVYETGWGDGADFSGRNWAMYITYEVQN